MKYEVNKNTKSGMRFKVQKFDYSHRYGIQALGRGWELGDVFHIHLWGYSSMEDSIDLYDRAKITLFQDLA